VTPDLAELSTPRLRLRQWRDDDREPFALMNADPEVMRWFPAPQTREESDLFVDRFVETGGRLGYTFWAVEVVDSERGPTPFAGFIGLQPPSFEPPFAHAEPCVEIGWRLARDWWGLGLATEGARAALDYALEERRLPEVVSFTVPPNLRSQAVMQRIGMSYSGVFTHPRGEGQWWGPHALYRIRQGTAK
jgi:RimJ/RimL family protein N-acetyltransferase